MFSALVTKLNNAAIGVQVQLLAAGSTGTTNTYLQDVAKKIGESLQSCLPFVWIVAAIAMVGVGLCCIIGNDRTKEMAKSKAVYIIVGCAVVLGALYLGKGICDILTIDDMTFE